MRPQSARVIIGIMTCIWVALIQPGLSYYWLIDPYLHAEIDAEEYGQTPDGHMLPGHPWRPPHEHPSGATLSTSDLTQRDVFDATFYAEIFSPAIRPALQHPRLEIDVIAEGADILPPDHPPRI